MNDPRTGAGTARPHLPRRLALFLAIGVLATPALADIQIESKTRLRASGMLSMLESDSKSTTSLSGERLRSVSEHKAKGKMMAAFSSKQDQVNIVRLDRGLSWDIDPKKRQYSEIELASLGEQFEAMNQQLASLGAAPGGGAAIVSDEACRLSEPRVEVDRTGESKKIAGQRAQQVVVRVNQRCEMPEREQICEIRQSWESWLAPDAGMAKELLAFQEEFARQTRLPPFSFEQSAALVMLSRMFGGSWEAAEDAMNDLEGFPLQSTVKLEFGGEQCQGLGELQAATAELMDAAAHAAVDGAMDEAANQAGDELARQTAQIFGNGPLEQIAGAGVGQAAGEVVTGLFGKLRKRRAEGKKGTAKPAVDVVFEISTRVTRIRTDALSPSLYEIPAGYARIDAPGSSEPAFKRGIAQRGNP